MALDHRRSRASRARGRRGRRRRRPHRRRRLERGSHWPLHRAQDARTRSARPSCPGLIDCHAHAGHGLLKTMGGGDSGAWMDACRVIYTSAPTRTSGTPKRKLAALERLKCGTTTGVCLFGGGDSIMRVDDPRYAARHCAAIAETGTRSFLAVGPRGRLRRAPTHRGTAVGARSARVSWDECAPLRGDHPHAAWRRGGRVNICITLPVYAAAARSGPCANTRARFATQAARYAELARSRALGLTQDGHREGTLALAHDELGLLGATPSCRTRSTSPPRTSQRASRPAPASSTTRARSCRSAAAARCRN